MIFFKFYKLGSVSFLPKRKRSIKFIKTILNKTQNINSLRYVSFGYWFTLSQGHRKLWLLELLGIWFLSYLLFSDNLNVDFPPRFVKNGDIINLVHGTTGRGLNRYEDCVDEKVLIDVRNFLKMVLSFFLISSG